MYDNYNYPPGADTPDAPWNQVELDPIDVNVVAEVTLVHNAKVATTNYVACTDEEDGSYNEELYDGYKDIEEYYKEQHKSIPDLLNELAKYIKGELAGENLSYQRRQELELMLEDCEDWEVSNIEIEDFIIS
jgi:hypothetical protein